MYIHWGLNSQLASTQQLFQYESFIYGSAELRLCAWAVSDGARVLPVRIEWHAKMNRFGWELRRYWNEDRRDRNALPIISQRSNSPVWQDSNRVCPCLFIVIGLTMSLRCGFEWSPGGRLALFCDCSLRYSTRVCVGMIRHCVPAYCRFAS